LCVLVKVTLTALDDLTARERSRVDTTEAVHLRVGPLVGLRWRVEHRVCKLDVADPVASLCTLGGLDKLAHGAVRLLLLGERRVGRWIGGSRRPVAENQHNILVRYGTNLF